jgi:GNAT superfamily N-acetyltransferase
VPVSIRAVEPADKQSWLAVFREYIAFYDSELPDANYALTWERLNSDFPIRGLVAESDGRIVGLAHYLFRPSTWSLEPFCYLEDLYVDPRVRNQGVGRALIAEIQKIAQEAGSPRLYWTTAPDNLTARSLYDQIATTDRVQYKIALSQKSLT